MTDSQSHRHRVALQQRVHETRRLLLEAADRLRDLDEATRRDQSRHAADSHEEALELLAASHHQLRLLGSELRGQTVRAARPRAAVTGQV